MAEISMDSVLNAFGVPATVTPPGGEPIITRIVWIRPLTDNFPSGEFARRERRWVGALSRDEVPAIPTGTEIVAPETRSGPPRSWRVDGVDVIEADHYRVVVVGMD